MHDLKAMRGGGGGGQVRQGGGGGGAQLTRSLERILEDANFSGQLRISGRKLKDFPKIAGQFVLGDTIFAGECWW